MDPAACPFQTSHGRHARDDLDVSENPQRGSAQGRGGLSVITDADTDDIVGEANRFLELMERETETAATGRLADVCAEIQRTATYHHTFAEVEHGARVAWRNNTRCIGRFYWRSLQVRDLRHLDDVEEIFEAIVDHLRLSTNGGRIRPMITVFAPQEPGVDGLRIWNSQLIRYAGHRRPDGSITGDPLNAQLTEAVRALGWPGGSGGRFDVLPLAIQKPGEAPRLFELPADVVMEVPLCHPDLPWFEEMELRWHALPVISNMRLEVGGVSYTAAPFSGWYMSTEIGARNLGDVERYNLLPAVAERMGLSTRSNRSLWRDRAIVELNVAVVHSFAKCGVAIVDHHAASRQFVHHVEKESEAGRIVPAEWSWIVPPISGSTTPVFHDAGYPDVTLRPNFFYQPDPWCEPRPAPADVAFGLSNQPRTGVSPSGRRDLYPHNRIVSGNPDRAGPRQCSLTGSRVTDA